MPIDDDTRSGAWLQLSDGNIEVTGQIVPGADPSSNAWEIMHPETGAEYTIEGPLPAAPEWNPRPPVDYITLVVDPTTHKWVPSCRYREMGSGANEHTVRGKIDGDPYQDNWTFEEHGDAGPQATTVTNPLPPLPPENPASRPDRWKMGDYISLNCKIVDPGIYMWLPAPRFDGLGA